MKFHHRRARIRFFLILSAVVLLALVLAMQFGKPHQTDVQKYLARLHAQGEKVTFTELIHGIAPDSSLAHDFMLTNVQRLPSYQQLAQQSPIGDPYTPTGQAGVDWRRLLSPMTSADGKALPWDQFNEIMLQAQEPLREIREGLKTTSLVGIVGTNATDLMPKKGINKFVNAARWFRVTVTGKLHQGRPSEALEDLESMTALAGVNLCPLIPRDTASTKRPA